MKLKKILASFTAAAMAVSAVPAIVSADTTWVSSLPYRTEADDNLWYETVYDVPADLLTVSDASKAYVYFTYTSTDSTQWGSQYELKQKDSSWSSITGCVNVAAVSESTPVLVPYDESKMADGIYFTGWNVIVPEIGVTYGLGKSSINVESNWDKTVKVNASDIPEDTKYIGITYSSLDTSEWGSQYQIGISGTDPYEKIIPCTNLSVAASEQTIFVPYSIFASLSDDAVLDVTGWNINISEFTYYGNLNTEVLPTSVNVTPSTAALVVGDTTTLTAEVLPADATDPTITWTSSNDKVASVDENGKVTAVAEGKATITATSNADSAIFGSCEVTVVSPDAEKYALNITKPENGTVAIKGDITEAFADETIELVITPDADYALDTVTVNGKAISGTSFTMPAEDVTIVVTFKKVGSADAEIVAPEGVNVSFTGSKEDILKAVFGDNYADLVAAGYKLDVVMTVKDETAVSADDKALVEGALSSDMHIGLIIDVSLVMTKDGVSTVVANSSKPVSFAIGVPDSIIADGRTYSVIRVHNGAAENIGGTYDAANKTITVASDKYSTYAVVYKNAPAPQPEPTVTYYPITADRNVTTSASTAAAGTQVNVRVDFGYDAYVYCGGRVINKITESGSFTMPAGKVTIVSQANGYLVMIKNAAPNSYIFVYDADMNYIKTNGSVKGIKGEGKITVKLGEEYAGKTVTLYKGRKSTSVKLDSLTLDKNGNATFTVEGGKNYTAVVE